MVLWTGSKARSSRLRVAARRGGLVLFRLLGRRVRLPQHQGMGSLSYPWRLSGWPTPSRKLQRSLVSAGT